MFRTRCKPRDLSPPLWLRVLESRPKPRNIGRPRSDRRRRFCLPVGVPRTSTGHPRRARRDEAQRRGSAPVDNDRLPPPRPPHTTLYARLVTRCLLLIGRRPGDTSGARSDPPPDIYTNHEPRAAPNPAEPNGTTPGPATGDAERCSWLRLHRSPRTETGRAILAKQQHRTAWAGRERRSA